MNIEDPAVVVQTISVGEFFEIVEGPLEMRVLAGRDGFDRRLESPRLQKPGLALAGYTAFVHTDRLQVLGETELSYLKTLDADARTKALETLTEIDLACIVVTKGLRPPEALVARCEARNIPLMWTNMTSSKCIPRIRVVLEERISSLCTVHGVLVDVDGVGILITGASGIGKSECALDLLGRGHRLVADDVVEIRQRGEVLLGKASDLIQHLIEVRGLGVLNVAELFGVGATRDTKRIELIVELEAWSSAESYDRLGLDSPTRTILNHRVPALVVPVQSGRDIAAIIEVAARNYLLQLRGHHAGKELSDRIQRAMHRDPSERP